MPLRRAASDQPRQVVEFLRVAVDEAERQVQPVAVRLRLERRNGVQISVEASDLAALTLFQIEHGTFQHLRQLFAAFDY